jgi:Tfp pilus assembly protein PilF
MDALFNKLEKTLKQQYLDAGTSERAQAEIDEALQLARDETRQQQSGE